MFFDSSIKYFLFLFLKLIILQMFNISNFLFSSELFFFVPEIAYISFLLCFFCIYIFFFLGVTADSYYLGLPYFRFSLSRDVRVLDLFVYSFIWLHILTFLLYFTLLNVNQFMTDGLNIYIYFDQIILSNRILLFKIFLVLFSLFFFIISISFKRLFNFLTVDHYFLFLFSTFGGFILLSANNFLVFFLALEITSIPLYILSSSDVKSNYSTESGLKYLVMGALSSGFILLGLSLLYGSTGVQAFSDLSLFLSDINHNFFFDPFFSILLFLGFIFLLFGILMKMGVAPLHFWMPDVYNGAPLSSTLFFMTVQKYLMWVFLFELINYKLSLMLSEYFLFFVLILILFNFVFGIFPALFQFKLKKLLIYSSIGVNGLLLICFFNGSLVSFFVFLLFYVLNTFGMFSLLFLLQLNSNFYYFLNKFSSLIGLSKLFPVITFFCSIILISLAGLPPAVGFITKFSIYYSLFNEWSFFVLISILASVIMSFYYFRIIKFFYISDNKLYTTDINLFFLNFNDKCLNLLLIYVGVFNLVFLFYYKHIFLFFSIFLFPSF